MAITDTATGTTFETKKDGQAESGLPPVVEIAGGADTPKEDLNGRTHLGSEEQAIQHHGDAPVAGRFGARRRVIAGAHAGFGFMPAAAGVVPTMMTESPEHKLFIIATERFFSGYISQLYASWNDDEITETNEAIEKAVLLVRALREALLTQTAYHRMTANRDADPFFQEQRVPGLKAVMASIVLDSSKDLVADISLMDYVSRLNQHHPYVLFPQQVDVNRDTSDLIRVGVSADPRDSDFHLLLMPDHIELLSSVSAVGLKFETAA
ncbi:hypothetical protein [Ralstonia phage RP31]|uniref:Uncharacterized protein n=2 Tax=Ripduovirus RP12 TaxID=2560700 RepID=A0A1L7N0T4_9CAUD|nr:hypothetical protein FDH28_gp104 [Ralstonia phage RP12]BAW19078.1 hypothetical protein [Ralstonia phage RP12]BAW19363.1 hypothetical protein [Ralstonia phage RP31]